MVEGALTLLGQQTPLQSGLIEGEGFTLFGQILTAVGPTEYILKGSIQGDRLTAMAYTPKGNMPVTGQRTLAGKEAEPDQ